MPSDELTTHETITRSIQSADVRGWEFVCPTCGYRARYTARAQRSGPQLEIVHFGDPQARHTSNHTLGAPVEDWPAYEADEETQDWIAPDLRQQIEELLKDVDMGDWDDE